MKFEDIKSENKSNSIRGIQMSERYILGLILALVGGYLDAYTYICRGKVFANAQTGNIVLFGVNMADGMWSKAFLYLLPIISFILGIFCAEIIKNHFKNSTAIHWRQIIIMMELIVLVGVGFIPSGEGNTIANILISFVCSLQVQSFRKIKGIMCATTMCTGNLRSAVENFCIYKRDGSLLHFEKAASYTGIVILFIMGAALGALLTGFAGTRSIYFAAICLMVVFSMMFVNPVQQTTNKEDED